MLVLAAGLVVPRSLVTPVDFSVCLANIKVCVLFWLVLLACFGLFRLVLFSWPFAYLANLCYALLLACLLVSTRHNIRGVGLATGTPSGAYTCHGAYAYSYLAWPLLSYASKVFAQGAL